MTTRKFFRAFVLSLLSLAIIALVFSFSDFSKETIENETFGAVYDYASENSKERFFSQMERSCFLIESGMIETNATNLENLCEDFQSIPEKEFFLKLILSSKGEDNKTLSSLEVISKIMHDKIILIVLIAIFVVLTYLLSEETNDLILQIGKILFRVGLLIILSYAFLSIYAHYANVDTSSIFEAFMVEDGAVDLPSTLINVIPILFLRIFKVGVIILAVVFIIINIVIKSYIKSEDR